MELIDTHCHLHELEGNMSPTYQKWRSDGIERTSASVLAAAQDAGVKQMIAIGTTLADSRLAVAFAQAHEGVWASVGIHPHDAAAHDLPDIEQQFRELLTQDKVVAVGECGLDYFYTHSPKDVQKRVLAMQIKAANDHVLPISFHVRNAFDDFWPIFDDYVGTRGVLHSFTDTEHHMQQAIDRGLYIGVNGIATFTSDASQRAVYVAIPDNRLLLETDAPYLTPKPFRGKMCEPKHVLLTAEFLAELRGQSLQTVARSTTANARQLFGLKLINLYHERHHI